MKFVPYILLTFCLISSVSAMGADEPVAFEKFFKKTMKVTPGVFPVYQDGTKYFLEIADHDLNNDILVVGDIARGSASDVAQSSGIVRFSKGTNNNLNITKQVYKEAVSIDYNKGLESLIQESSLIPVNFVVHIEALGKDKKSYIIDLTKELMSGGDLFSFKDFSGLSRSDASRSGVQFVKAAKDGVVFSVLRTQTDPGSSAGASKSTERASAFLLNLILQNLSAHQMAVRETNARIGFESVSYNDFGKNPYVVKEVKVIKKWDLKVKAADLNKYRGGVLVEPEKPIQVFIDKTTPVLFVPYIKQAIQEWNSAFAAAGFKNVLIMSTDERDNFLSSGKILIKWGNTTKDVITKTLEDPRTGEILAAKMNISDQITDALLPTYFVECGLNDPRILRNLNDPQLRGEIMRWKVAQAFAGVFGMLPNLYGSAAYTSAQQRSASWLKNNSFTSSITDDTQFNYVVQPNDHVPVTGLIAGISTYDKMAIGWAYRVFPNAIALKKATTYISYNNTSFRYLPENKNDVFTQHWDLAADQIHASELGMKNISVLYPQLEKITGQMADRDDDWSDFTQLAAEFQMNYDTYASNITTCIGGQSLRPMIKGYNDVPVVYLSKKEQQTAFEFLNTYVFSGVPRWMQNARLKKLNAEAVEVRFQRLAERTLNKMVSPEVIGNLIKAENAKGEDAFTIDDLFKAIDHYVFKDFNAVNPVDEYTAQMQTTFIYNLAQAAHKNEIAAGLNENNEVIYLYFVKTVKSVINLSKSHSDPLTRDRYQLMKVEIEKEYLQK